MDKLISSLKILTCSAVTPWTNRTIGIDEFKKYINTDFSEAYQQYLNGNIIYRGDKNINMQDGIAVYIVPGIRKSQNTTNYYTELFSNILPSWKEYPKRDHSIICTSNKKVAAGFGEGNSYIIFLKNGTKLGICPYSDIWCSFMKIFKNLIDYKLTLKTFNEVMEKIIKSTKYTDFKTLLDNFKNINIDDIKYFKVDEYDQYGEAQNKLINILYKHKDNIIEFLDTLLNPKTNGFELTNIDQYKKLNNREIWFDAECIFIIENKENEKFLENING
jgi:hypothetical protein